MSPGCATTNSQVTSADSPAETPPGVRAAHAFRAACEKASSAGVVARALASNPSPSQEAPVPLRQTTRGKDIARLALTLATVPVVIHRVVLTPRARENREQNHRQQAEFDRNATMKMFEMNKQSQQNQQNAAIKMLEKSIAQAQKLKTMLKGQRSVPTPAKRRELVEKNEEVVEVAKIAHALVAKIIQG
eukprot:gene27456-4759_t